MLRLGGLAIYYVGGISYAHAEVTINGNTEVIAGRMVNDRMVFNKNELDRMFSRHLLSSYDRKAGITLHRDSNTGRFYKDVSVPLSNALEQTAQQANIMRQMAEFPRTGLGAAVMRGAKYSWFEGQVNRGRYWDIKLPDSWNRTIGRNTFPGDGTRVSFLGALMTPEQLGNFNYGFIGAALGLTWAELIAGSWSDDGFTPPGNTPEFMNEFSDWAHILRGYFAFNSQR